MDRINIEAPIGYTGYGVVGRNIAYELATSDVDVSLFPIGNSIECPTHQKETLLRCIQNRENFSSKSPSLKIWHQNDLAMFPGSPRIAYTFFELDTLKPNEVHHLQQCDKVLVACDWAQRVCQKHDINAEVLPCGVSDVFKPKTKRKNTKCVFLNIGKWEVRKGHLELARAFGKLLGYTRDVELWMMSENRFYQNGENEWWKSYFRDYCGTYVKFLNWVPNESDVANIMQQADIGVFPAKAEAWNLELLEMMACGKQVICTNYSGHSHFANSNNATLLEPEGLETATDACEAHPDGFWFKGFGKWAKINTETLTSHMVNTYDTWNTNDVNINTQGILAASIYSWKNATKRLKELL